MNEQMSVDLGTTEITFAPLKPKVKHEWYIRAKDSKGWYFLHLTHANGSGEWELETMLTINGGRMKPLRYKTCAGAKRAAGQHLNRGVLWEVVEWKENKKQT